ncbi:hypothetical protein GQX73_g10075 [Xylaria multiplex]|uniref:Heterokaryon incompatibility domain-containing protein n=1 Tax=Xylaria multiplex TaxID=323545 RepID=A0A7C8MXU9_9PEZI|nr:hypothetical protein GQX73_g10075 [Xylaria multiplex]
MTEILHKPQVPTEFTACEVCHQIWLHLTGSAPKDQTLIGSFEQGLSNGCSIHSPLLEAFRDYIGESRFPVKCEDVGIRSDRPPILISSLETGGAVWPLLLANTASAQNSAGQGRILDPDWVDVKFLRDCKRKCLQTHGGKCDNPMRISPVTPMLLVDVQQNCIVSGHDAGPYVALSYVWGISGPLRRSNVPYELLEKLSQPNGLDSLDAKPYMSPVIRRAITLVALLGERWLWVDVLYGLPESHFDRFLGWHPFWGHTNLQRRIRSDRPSDALIGPSELPSWSWVGWQGLIDIGTRYDATNFNARYSSIAETIPIVTWYTSESPTGHKRRKITPTFLENIPKFKEVGDALPSGWTRLNSLTTSEFRGEPNIYPDGCGQYLYSHANLKERFYYPFPVADITEDTPSITPPQTAYLFCETQKGRLYAKPTGKKDLVDDMDKFIVDFRDENSTVVGKLHLHNEEQLSLFTGSNAPGADSSGNMVEVVAISKRREYAKTWKEELQRYDSITTENLYVVLWVEWIDNIAYRLASGTVKEEAWEKLNLENVSLVLG